MMNILLIETDPVLAEEFINAFSEWGHKSEWSVTGTDALERARQRNFDIILMDIFLPDIHAYELIPQIKEFQTRAGIVTMTDNNSRELELQVRKQGIIFYMVKPFSITILKKILDHILKKNQGRTSPSTKSYESNVFIKHTGLTILLIFTLFMNFPTKAFSEDENLHLQLQQALEESSRLRADLHDHVTDDSQDASLLSIKGRISYSKPCNEKNMKLGIGGHYGKEEADAISCGGNVDVSTWSANADLPFQIGHTEHYFAKYLSVGLELSYWQTENKDDSDGDDVRNQNSWMLTF